MRGVRAGFTLVELLVVIGIIGVLCSIMAPVLSKARESAKRTLNQSNLRQIALAVNGYGLDNNDRTPPSQGYIWPESGHLTWHDSRLIYGYPWQVGRQHDSVFPYLRGYIEDPRSMFCPQAPGFPSYMQEAWDKGNSYSPSEPDYGHYCFLWGGYTAYNLDSGGFFQGPSRLSSNRRGVSKVLACDYFGYNNCNWVDDYTGWKYASCNRFKGADKTPGKEPPPCHPVLWMLSDRSADLDSIEIGLYAALIDGSVRSYTASDVISVKPYNTKPDDYSYGVYYLPDERLF